MGDGSSSPAEENAGTGGAIFEVASHRVTRLRGILARRRPPTASPSSRRMPEPNTGDRNSHGSRVDEFRTAKLRRGSPDVCPRPGCGEDDRRLLRFSNGFCSVRVFDDSTARRSAAAASREHRPGASRAGWRLRQSHHRLQRSLQPGMTPVPIALF